MAKSCKIIPSEHTSRYVIEKEKAELIGGNLFGETLDAMVDELAMTKALNPEIARPVYHLTQSYTAADQETGKLTPTRLAQLATRHFAGMVVSASEPALLEDTAAFQQRGTTISASRHSHAFLLDRRPSRSRASAYAPGGQSDQSA